MRNFRYRNKSLDRFRVAVGRINTSPDHNRGLINIQVASVDSPEKTYDVALSVPWAEVHSCYKNIKGKSASGTIDIEAWNVADHTWENVLNEFAKYVIIFDRLATFADRTILMGRDRADGLPLYVENGNLIFTQSDLLQIEENRIARRLALKTAYKKGQEGVRIGEIIGGISLSNITDEELSFDKNVFLRAVRVLESASLLRSEQKDVYHITLAGQLKYEQSFASFQDKAFIIAWCKDEIKNQIIPVYEEILGEFGYKAIFQENEEPNKSIHIDIFDYIANVPLIIADLSGERANCYIELGYAMALNKRIILTMKEGPEDEKRRMGRMAFDTISMKYSFYKGPDDLEQQIRERVKVNHEMIRKAAEI